MSAASSKRLENFSISMFQSLRAEGSFKSFLQRKNYLNSLITSLKKRFDQRYFKAYENLESLLLTSLSNKSIANKMKYVKLVFKGDLDVYQPVVEL